MSMTKLLDEAIAQVRELPQAEQDLAAEALFAVLHRDAPDTRLSPEQANEVRRIRAGLRDGSIQLATDDEVAAMWRSFGL